MTVPAQPPPAERLAKLRSAAAVCLGMQVTETEVRDDGILGLDLVRPSDHDAPTGPQRMKLRVYTTAWRLDAADRVLAGSGDETVQIERTVTALVGLPVTAIDITAPSGDTTIEFQGLRLRIFPVYFGPNKDSVTWTLRPVPGKRQLVAGPGSAWSIRTSHAVTEKSSKQ